MQESKLIVAALLELSEAVDELKAVIPVSSRVPIETLASISVDQVDDDLYAVTGICPGCGGIVQHYIDTRGGFTMDAQDCVSECDGMCPGGYMSPVTLSIFGVPVLAVNLENPSPLNLRLASGGDN